MNTANHEREQRFNDAWDADACAVAHTAHPHTYKRKCGAHMASVVKDPHPTCTRCRGRNCKRDSTCISCNDWSLAQWTAFDSFNARRSNTDRKRSSNRH